MMMSSAEEEPGPELARVVDGAVPALVGGAVGFVVVGAVGALQVSVYAAGLDAVVAGLVTTSTASPEPEARGGVNVSGCTALAPGPVNVKVAGAEFAPSDRAQ
jgi:hypothetical protein